MVEPGKIYRGAWQKPWPMQRLVRDYKIRTILALAHPRRAYLSVHERALARELGFRWIHIPIIDQRGTKDRDAGEERSPTCSMRRRPSSPTRPTIRSSSTAITA